MKTDETRERLIKAARAGYSSLEAIARAAGISEDTLLVWRNEDPTLEPELRAVIAARLDAIEANVLDKAVEDARIGLTVLERRRPEAYGRKNAVELSGPGGGPIELVKVVLHERTDEEIRAEQAALRRE